METSTAILLGLAGAAGAWWLLSRSSSAPGAGPRPPVALPPSNNGIYTGSNLGPFAPVTALPGVGLAYKVLAPINDKLLQPVVSGVQAHVINPINSELGFHAPTVTMNADGTYTRQAGYGPGDLALTVDKKVVEPIGSGIKSAYNATLGKVLPW